MPMVCLKDDCFCSRESCDGYDSCKERKLQEQTNEEWVRSAPSTEELVERIVECAMTNSWAMNETQFKNGVRGWLKKVHRESE